MGPRVPGIVFTATGIVSLIVSLTRGPNLGISQRDGVTIGVVLLVLGIGLLVYAATSQCRPSSRQGDTRNPSVLLRARITHIARQSSVFRGEECRRHGALVARWPALRATQVVRTTRCQPTPSRTRRHLPRPASIVEDEARSRSGIVGRRRVVAGRLVGDGREPRHEFADLEQKLLAR